MLSEWFKFTSLHRELINSQIIDSQSKMFVFYIIE